MPNTRPLLLSDCLQGMSNWPSTLCLCLLMPPGTCCIILSILISHPDYNHGFPISAERQKLCQALKLFNGRINLLTISGSVFRVPLQIGSHSLSDPVIHLCLGSRATCLQDHNYHYPFRLWLKGDSQKKNGFSWKNKVLPLGYV